MSSITNLTEATFAEEINASAEPVVVDFWATWCKPCAQIAPLLEEIAVEQAGRLRITKVDVDNNPNVAQQFNVMSIPTIIVFKDGVEVQRIVGAKGKAQLLEEFSAHI